MTDKSPKNSDEGSYISKITFNPLDFGRMLSGYVTNMRLVVLLLCSLVIAGISSYITLPRTLAPEINITIVTVSSVLPGATPEDVEQLLLDPLEDELESIDGVDTMTGTASAGSAVVVLQFLSGINQITAMADVRDAVSAIGELPEDATTPVVRLVDFEDEPILRYAIIGDADATSRERLMATLSDRLEEISIVDRIELSGVPTQEVQIVIDEQKRAALGIDVRTIQDALSASLKSLPTGSARSETSLFGLAIDRSVYTLEDVRQVRFRQDGVQYTLGDIAMVMEAPVPGNVPSLLTTPDGVTQGVATIDVYRTIGAKISDVTTRVESVMERFFAENSNFSFIEIANTNTDIEEQFQDLVGNLSITVGLVFLVLLLFVGVRQASVAALSIPLVFMATFITMQITGISINFLSLFSLLLALGLLVDVTIVVVSAMTKYYRSGRFNAREAGLLVWKDYLVTLSVTTLTTVWAFVPLLLATGIIGEYIKPIPIIVSSMLVASVAIGFLIILPLMVWLFEISMPRRVRFFLTIFGGILGIFVVQGILSGFSISIPGWGWLLVLPVLFLLIFITLYIMRDVVHALGRSIKRLYEKTGRRFGDDMSNGFIDARRIERVYRRVLTRMILKKGGRRRIVAMVALFFIFSVSLVAFGLVRGEFFPGEDQDQFYMHLELAEGTRAEASLERAREVLPQLFITDEIIRVQTQVGFGVSSEGAPTGGGSNDTLFTVDLTPGEERTISSQQIVADFRNAEFVQQYPFGTIRVAEIGSGPPAGADITVKLIGDELSVLNEKADELIAYLNETSGVTNARKSVLEGTAKISFVPNEQIMNAQGVTRGEIASAMSLFGNGVKIEEDITFDDLTDERDIVVRTSQDRAALENLETLTVTAADGFQLPLGALGTFELVTNPTQINHEGGDRVLTVEAGVNDGEDVGAINREVATFADTDLNLPIGYLWQTGGANEESQESTNSILQAMVLALILIFLTLIILLNSYRKSFIVLLVIPPAISGVFFVFALTGMPLSFPALIGVLALFGIVINNSIIIIDQINKNRAQGLSFDDAVVDGAASRLDPIMMSSMTTIVGLLPITLSEPVWQGLGGAIISGLIFSGTIMLFFIPTVYYMMFEKEEV